MPNVKTNAILPKGEENGLADIAGILVAEGANRAPKRLRAVLGIIDTKRVGIESDTGEEVATVRFRRVEVLLSGDLPAAEKLLRRSLEARSGQTTLELELEDEIRQAFEAMQEPDSPDDPDDKGDKGGKGKGAK
jgi:hypothetical protein